MPRERDASFGSIPTIAASNHNDAGDFKKRVDVSLAKLTTAPAATTPDN
jgi:hypothetical protein